MSDLLKIEGMQEVIREIQKLDSDVIKRREILKVLRRQSKPILRAIKKEAPVEKRGYTITRRLSGTKGNRKTADVYEPGNLKRSLAIKTSPLKSYPSVLIGFRYGTKYKYDGYYGNFVIWGYAGKNRYAPNDFIMRGAAPLLGDVYTKASDELKKYIEKQIKSKINI